MSSSYPILEYDYSSTAVFQPDQQNLGIHFPPCVAFPFVGNVVDRYAADHGLPVIATYETVTKDYPIYRISDTVCLCQAPIGAPVAVQLMDWLIAYGVERVISVASCGALIDLPENALVVPRRALRDEGTSYHYMPPSRWSYLDDGVQQMVKDVFDAEGIAYTNADVWTTDAIYRETIDKVRRSRSEGCGVVDMQCAALASCADFRRAQFGQFLYVTDSLADTEAYDRRNWGKEALLPMLELCVKIAEQEYHSPWG